MVQRIGKIIATGLVTLVVVLGLGYGWGARVVVLAREGKPLAIELNQAILDQTFYAVSKISKNKDAAWDKPAPKK